MRLTALVAAVLACDGGRSENPPATQTTSHGSAVTEHSSTSLVVRVTADGQPVGARVLLLDSANRPLHLGQLDGLGVRQGATACTLGPGVVGSWDGLIIAEGTAEIPIGSERPAPCRVPYGEYNVWAWRGIEYELFKGRVALPPNRGRVPLDIALERAWNPVGTLAADLHVHAQASNDSAVPNPQRVVAQVAAGIQVIGLSDHNVHGDLNAEIAALHLEPRVVSIRSNELGSAAMHLGIYPAIGAGPDPETIERADTSELFRIARSLPGRPVVQLNHPRLRSSALYDAAGWNGVSWPPPFPLEFDAVEVLAGHTAFNVPGDRRFDTSVTDLYTLFSHGHLVAPLGNSDTHDLNWVLDGTTRNYVFVDDPRTQPFDEPGFVAAIRARRVVATSGPWLDVGVAPTRNSDIAPRRGAPQGNSPWGVGPGQCVAAASGAVWVEVTVSQTRWMKVDRIRINVGPSVARTIDVPPGVRVHRWEGRVPVGRIDTFIGITADGDSPLPLELTGTYQKDRWHRPGVTPFAIASPILVDADNDGRWRRGDANASLSQLCVVAHGHLR